MDLDRIKRNVGKMVQMNAPEAEIDQYIASEGTSVEAVRTHRMSAPPQQKPEMTGAGSAALQGVGQGLTFGFSDEIEGAVRGAYDAVTSDKSFSDAYADRRDAARERLDRAAEDQPLAYYGGEIGSALAVPAGVARLGIRGAVAGAAGKGIGARTVAGAKEGAAYGAAYGTGTAEGGLGERAMGAAQGGALGGVIGAAVPGVIDAGAAVWQRGIANPVRGYTNPRQVASEKLGEAMARDLAGQSSTGRDMSRAQRRFDARANAMATDPNAMAVDIGGQNTRRLVRQAQNMPNDNVQRFNARLDQRQNSQWRRIESGLKGALGSPDDYARTLTSIIARRSGQAKQDFANALAVEVPMTPQLESVLQRPAVQSLMRNVEANMANEGQSLAGETTMGALHRLKVELDNEIGRAKRAQAMGNDRTAGMDARTLTILKKDLLGAVDNPSYRNALDNFAGDSALAGAAEDGFESALRMQPEEIAPHLKSMATSEQDMWRLGAARALAGRIRKANKTSDRTENIFSSPDMEMRLKAIFPDQRSLREFQRLLVREARKADTRKAVQGGSATDTNTTTSAEAEAPAALGNAMFQAARGDILGPTMMFLGRAKNRVSGFTPQTANAMLEMAMRHPSQGMDPLVHNAMARAAGYSERRAKAIPPMLAGAMSYAND